MEIDLLAAKAAEGEQSGVPVDFRGKLLIAYRASESADHGSVLG